MKTLIAVILAGGIGFAAAYNWVSNQKEAALEQAQAEFAQERQQLEEELAEARAAQSGGIKIVRVPSDPESGGSGGLTPEEIIEILRSLRPGAGADRIDTIRQVVFYLESLVEAGPGALPAIRNYLALLEDVDYGSESRDDRRSRWGNFLGRTEPMTQFTLPPSLRFGLFDVLKRIGGPEAELILAEVLNISGRGPEVAYVTRILESMAPGQYREIALEAARDLLLNPLPIDHPNRLDERSRDYLWGILTMYNDGSFVWAAQNLLVDGEGRVDRNAMSYLSAMLGENAIPLLYEAYKSDRIQSNWDRASLANQVLGHAGTNPHANAMLREIVTDSEMDTRARVAPIIRLVGGEFGPVNIEQPSDPAVIHARLQLVESLKTEVGDDRMLMQALNVTGRNLQNLLSGEPLESPWSAFGGGRGERGGTERGRGPRGADRSN
jgi:hypothetical protein